MENRTVSQSEVIKEVAGLLNLPQSQIKLTMKAFSEIIAGHLDVGNSVRIDNICAIDVVQRAARTGRNPKTGEALQIPAKRVVTFKAAKALKDSVAP